MKKVICVSIDEEVDTNLNLFCEEIVDGMTYRLSKSKVVNDAIKDYLIQKSAYNDARVLPAVLEHHKSKKVDA
jgi:hypothetical protein